MSTRRDRIAAIVDRIGMVAAMRTDGTEEVTRQALLDIDQANAIDALMAASVVQPDDGEDRPLPPVPEPGAHVTLILRLPKRDDPESRHLYQEAILLRLDPWGVWWIPEDDETGALLTPWRDVEQIEGPRP